jgi:hypothetical protein
MLPMYPLPDACWTDPVVAALLCDLKRQVLTAFLGGDSQALYRCLLALRDAPAARHLWEGHLLDLCDDLTAFYLALVATEATEELALTGAGLADPELDRIAERARARAFAAVGFAPPSCVR